MKFEKTPEISSINYMKKVKLRVERGKSGYRVAEAAGPVRLTWRFSSNSGTLIVVR